MLTLLRHPVFQKLYAAQVVSLIGTGLATVALGLLAFELAGDQAGVVLGTALAIKMVAYVGVAPLAQAVLGRFSAKRVLVGLDIVRALIAVCLPFVSEIWQVYVLIFMLQSASAGFTPTFQALIPDILTDEDDYTKALSLSRMTYDLENLISPALAAILLTVMPFHWLFMGTAVGFFISAILVQMVVFPTRSKLAPRSFWDRLTNGTRSYLATPRLRGLLALSFAAAAGSSMILVNSVVITRVTLGLEEQALGFALAAYGAGSIIAAIILPHLLKRTGDRGPMLLGASGLGLVMFAAAWVFRGDVSFTHLLVLWLLSGLTYSTILTPSGRLLNRSSQADNKAAIFTAQFALSHACWLITYPLAGWLGATQSMSLTFAVFGALAMIGALVAFLLWPQQTGAGLLHSHDDLPENHPHIQGASHHQHHHPRVIDDLHPHWPSHR